MSQLPYEMSNTSYFPDGVVDIIAGYAAQWTVAQWLQDIKLEDMPVSFVHLPALSLDEQKMQLLSGNPKAEDELHGLMPRWHQLCGNSADWALDLLEANPDRIDMGALSCNANPRAIALLEANLIEIHWHNLSTNRGAIDILSKNLDKISHYGLQQNSSPRAIDLIRQLHIVTTRHYLLPNSSSWAVDILLETPLDDMEIQLSAGNRHPRMVALHDPSKMTELGWLMLSTNPGAIDILKAHPHKVTMEIWQNPAIFEPTVPTGLVDALLILTW